MSLMDLNKVLATISSEGTFIRCNNTKQLQFVLRTLYLDVDLNPYPKFKLALAEV